MVFRLRVIPDYFWVQDKGDFQELGISIADATFLLEESRTLKYHGLPRE